MGDTLLPEILLLLSLYIVTVLLDTIVLAPDRRQKDTIVYAVATVTTVLACIAAVNMTVLVARSFIVRFVS